MKPVLIRLLILVIGWVGLVGGWIASGPPVEHGSSADIAIVLGAAVDGSEPSPVFAARIDHAIDLYRAGRVKRLLFTGGQSVEDDVSEARAAARYALRKGVPSSVVMLEQRSRTTRQNLEYAAAMLGQAASRPVLVVSDPLHMRRALAIAGDVGLEARASPTPHSRYRSLSTKLPFLAREVWFVHAHWLFGL